MATLYKRGSRYYINWREDGVQFRRSLGAIDRKAAEAIRAEKEAQLHGLITTTRGVMVGEILADYLDWYRTERPTTYGRAVSALKRFRAAFDGVGAESLPALAIQRWAAAQEAKGQAEKALKLARSAFKRAVQQRRLAYSPMDGVVIPRSVVSKAPEYYRPEQLRRLARTRHGAAWIFMAATGLRRGEMAKARRADVQNGVLLVESNQQGRTKSGKWRAIPLNAYARKALSRLGDDRLVTCHTDTLGDWFAAEARSVDMPGSLHRLRHTFCTVLAQQGVSLFDVMRLAGHSSVAVTEVYSHHAPEFGIAAVGTMGAWGKRPSSKQAQSRPRNPQPP